jgi:hypothetical protein
MASSKTKMCIMWISRLKDETICLGLQGIEKKNTRNRKNEIFENSFEEVCQELS